MTSIHAGTLHISLRSPRWILLSLRFVTTSRCCIFVFLFGFFFWIPPSHPITGRSRKHRPSPSVPSGRYPSLGVPNNSRLEPVGSPPSVVGCCLRRHFVWANPVGAPGSPAGAGRRPRLAGRFPSACRRGPLPSLSAASVGAVGLACGAKSPTDDENNSRRRNAKFDDSIKGMSSSNL